MPAGSEGAPVRARAACRVDLAGGTLDIWPLGLLHPGSRTVNVAVDVAVEVVLTARRRGYRVRQGEVDLEADDLETLAGDPEGALVATLAAHLELPPFEAVVASDSPRGGGLGASSALAVALLAAGRRFTGEPAFDPEAASTLARDLEAVLMGLPTGRQDHYPALLGGALEIRHRPGGERVRRLDLDLEELGRRLVVAYTGQSHFSAGTNWQIVRRRLERDPATTAAFQGIAAAAAALVPALEAGDWPWAGEAVSREWRHRRSLAPEVSTPRIDELLSAAAAAGAWGGKACGAGGGGSIALLCPPEARGAVEESLRAGGSRILPARPTAAALEVESLV
ncbi:MAG: hypothetical protein R3325_15650 [Thermoanaerobaculia bacterium]|nr:hypothetical protein [Thermoanaerobaculia bacterium]